MAVRREWDLEPSFGDALSGSGGLGEPVQPVFAGALTADVFPDALSTTFAGAVSAAPAPAVSSSALTPVAPISPPVPVRSAPASRRAPARPMTRPVSAAVPRGVLSGFPPPGVPAPGYAQPQNSQQPPPGYPAAGWAPLPGLPGGPTFRPAGQQRQAVGPQRQPIGFRPPLTVPRSPRKKSSSAWGFLFVLLIVLVTSGVGQKIINAISELLQRK